jgi:opacity protein-like surface antigen
MARDITTGVVEGFMKRILGAAVFAVAVLAIGAPARGAVIVLPRTGQVGVGVQGQYGGLAKQGELGDEFGTGAGLAVRLKYRMRYDRGMGLSFETRTLDGRGKFMAKSAFPPGAGADSLAPLKSLKLQTFGLDLYQFFRTRTRTQGFLSATAGLAKINAVGRDGDPVYPVAGDGMFLSVGAGAERFIYRSWAVDASVRYSAIFLDGGTNNDVQAAVGMIFYAAY